MKIYKVDVLPAARRDINRHILSGNKHLAAKVETLLSEIAFNPRQGTGKPERMRHMKGDMWSRHIDYRHRLVYSIEEDKLVVVAISAYGHYGDK